MISLSSCIIKPLLILDNILYFLITRIATYLESGLHPKHRLMKYHSFFLENISRNNVVLDIGCGIGALSYDLAKKAKEVFAIDVNHKNIEIAKRRYSAENIEYIVGEATKYDFKQEFDVIVLSNVLEHIKDRRSFLLRIKRLSHKFLIRVPLIERDWLVLYKKEKGIEYRLDKTHYIEYRWEDFKEEINQCGLKIDNFSIKFGELYSVVRG